MPRRKKNFWYISEIKPSLGKITLIATVIEKISVKEFDRGGEKHYVAEYLVGDKTGIIILVIWDEMIDKIKVGETYLLKNLRPKIYMNQLRIICTKDSTIEPAPFKIALNEINTSPRIG